MHDFFFGMKFRCQKFQKHRCIKKTFIEKMDFTFRLKTKRVKQQGTEQEQSATKEGANEGRKKNAHTAIVILSKNMKAHVNMKSIHLANMNTISKRIIHFIYYLFLKS